MQFEQEPVPPRPSPTRVALTDLWQLLPAPDQERLLQTLSRVVRQGPPPPAQAEVNHD